MYMATELDAGDIIAQASTPIDPDETVETLHDRLAQMGGELLVKTVTDLAAGTATRTPQDESKVTFAPLLSRALSPIDWTKPAKGHPRPSAGADALARHLHGHFERGDGEGVRRPGRRGRAPRKPPVPSCPPEKRASTSPAEMAR